MTPSLDLTARPTERTRNVDVDAEIDVQVDSRITGLGRAGLVVMAVGVVALLVGASLFIAAYPDTWKGRGVTFEESAQAVRTIVLTLTAGGTLLFLGASMFFNGRQVLGSGSIERLSLLSELEKPAAMADLPGHEGPIAAFDERRDEMAPGEEAAHEEDATAAGWQDPAWPEQRESDEEERA